MNTRDPRFDAYVIKIHDVLDKLDYYRLLGVDQAADAAAVRKAFYAIAAKFHPDRNRDADEKTHKALYDIFKRLNEAYRILCDSERRAEYDKGLGNGQTRLEQTSRRTATPKNPEDTIRNRDARQFFIKAVEEFKKGNLMNAQLHVKVAASRDPSAEVIKDLARQILEAKQSK